MSMSSWLTEASFEASGGWRPSPRYLKSHAYSRFDRFSGTEPSSDWYREQYDLWGHVRAILTYRFDSLVWSELLSCTWRFQPRLTYVHPYLPRQSGATAESSTCRRKPRSPGGIRLGSIWLSPSKTTSQNGFISPLHAPNL